MLMAIGMTTVTSNVRRIVDLHHAIKVTEAAIRVMMVGMATCAIFLVK